MAFRSSPPSPTSAAYLAQQQAARDTSTANWLAQQQAAKDATQARIAAMSPAPSAPSAPAAATHFGRLISMYPNVGASASVAKSAPVDPQQEFRTYLSKVGLADEDISGYLSSLGGKVATSSVLNPGFAKQKYMSQAQLDTLPAWQKAVLMDSGKLLNMSYGSGKNLGYLADPTDVANYLKENSQRKLSTGELTSLGYSAEDPLWSKLVTKKDNDYYIPQSTLYSLRDLDLAPIEQSALQQVKRVFAKGLGVDEYSSDAMKNMIRDRLNQAASSMSKGRWTTTPTYSLGDDWKLHYTTMNPSATRLPQATITQFNDSLKRLDELKNVGVVFDYISQHPDTQHAKDFTSELMAKFGSLSNAFSPLQQVNKLYNIKNAFKNTFGKPAMVPKTAVPPHTISIAQTVQNLLNRPDISPAMRNNIASIWDMRI